MEKVKVFLSYSHKDEDYKKELDNHLSPLKRNNVIEVWNDREIRAGSPWEKEIFQKLDEADLVLCLVSSDFISSDFCIESEYKRVLERHNRGECVIIPVIIRKCHWPSVMGMGEIQGVPKDGKAVSLWQDKDEAFWDAYGSINQTINQILDKKEQKRNLIDKSEKNNLETVKGKIDNSVPKRPFKSKINGTINEIPKGYQAWIFKKPSDVGNFHPEDGPLNVKGEFWENEIHIGNEKYGSHQGITFIIILTIVTNERGDELRQYMYDQNRRNLWPGLSSMGEIKILDQIIVTRFDEYRIRLVD